MKKLWEDVKEHRELIGYVILTVLLFIACFSNAFAWVAAVYIVLFALVLHKETQIVGLLLFVHCFYALFYYHRIAGISLDVILVGILILILLGLYIFRLIKRELKLNWKTLIPIALFLVYVVLPFHQYVWRDFFAMVFFFTIVYVVYESRRQIDFRRVVRVFVWGLLLSCSFALLRNVSSVLASKMELVYYLDLARFQGLTYHPNTLTKLLILAISALLILKYKNKISWTELAITVVPMFVFGYLTVSRSFVVAIVIALLFFIVFYFLHDKVRTLAFLGATLVVMCIVCGIFWNVTKLYFERISDKLVGTAEVNLMSNWFNLGVSEFTDEFDAQSAEWQNAVMAGEIYYDPGRPSLQALYMRDWSSSTQTIWLGRGISRPLIGQMSAHNLFIQELWKHGLVGFMFYLAMILGAINWKKFKQIRRYMAGLIVLVPYILITLVEQCLLDFVSLIVLISAFGYLGKLADVTDESNNEQVDPEHTLYETYVKRCLDVVLSGLGLIVLSPLFLIIVILSKIFIRGKVIYTQPRPGEGGKIFKLYKFRSMSDKRGPSGALLPDNERMTKFGKILRRSSLDELPQLVNILRGDMSIVGPRPRLVSDMIFYDQKGIAGHSVRPGLTGLDQVSGGRSHSTWEMIFQKNFEYQQRVTFWGDVKIIFLTILVLFKNDSAANGAEATQRDYYYDVYLLRQHRITQEQYDLGHVRAAQLIAENGTVRYQPDLQQFDNKAFNQIVNNKNEKEA